MPEVKENKHKRATGEGCIYQRKDKRWSGRLMCGRKPDGTPNIKSFSGKTEAEVRKKLNALIKKWNQDDFTEVRKISVGTYMMDWLSKVKVNVLKPKAYDRLEATLGLELLPISINQSRRHIHKLNYVDRFCEVVDLYAIPHHLLVFELTESAFVEGDIAVIALAEELHRLGFQLAIDDFGTGYAALNLLRMMTPIF